MAEDLSSDRRMAEEAIERSKNFVPGMDVPFSTFEEVRDGYVDLLREHGVLQSERDDLSTRLRTISQQVVDLQQQTAAVTASDYTQTLEATIAELRSANEFLRQRLAAG